MKYLPCVPLCYEHIARHARSIPRTPVFSHAFLFLNVNTMCDFERGGAKKRIMRSS